MRITLAEAISPYDKDLFDKVEPRMRPIVKEALDSGLLPISSCQGHGDLKDNTAYITIAFPCVTRARQFASLFNTNRDIVEISSLRDLCNVETRSDLTDYIDATYEEAVDYFNQLFLRKYNDYQFVKVKYYPARIFNQFFMSGWFNRMETIMTQLRSERIHRSETARTRRRKTKDILYKKTTNFFRKERWTRKRKQKSVS